ncbi:hypothetical protein CDD83_5483 [Cordyceps sp. RAO-2017]|nr:hypothetical protein CDD83_5483 [Cordyceps sp. RAO-2017]
MNSSGLSWSSPRTVRLFIVVVAAVVIYSTVGSWTSRGVLVSTESSGRVAWTDVKQADGPLAGTEHWHPSWALPMSESTSASADLERISNRTLGFEKIIAIGLPERSDKRDALELMAALTGFDIDWVDGVKSASISEKAVPFGVNMKDVQDNFLGSWRGHLNAVRRIVESGSSSALIMEDDMDWDAHLMLQLADIARGTRQILGDTSHAPHSPYGDSWDVLWLGHCGEPFPETLEENVGLEDSIKAKISAKYMINDEKTVPPYTQVSKLVNWSVYPPHTRLVHLTAAPICSFAYAITQSAARKILYALSIDGLRMAFDNSLAQLCRDAVYDLVRNRDGGYRLKCISVNPTIMFHHKAKGRLSGDSDIQSYGKDGTTREKGFSESIKWSMRLNLRNILTGQALEAQF